MNRTNISSNYTLQISANSAESYILVFSCLICVCISLTFNFSFIATYCRSQSLYKRSVLSLIINLIVLFLIDTLFIQLMSVVLLIEGGWPQEYPHALCIAQAFGINFIDSCISFTLLLMAIDRIIVIRAHFTNRRKMLHGLPKPLIVLSVICVWLLSICLSVPLVTNTISSVYISDINSCLPNMDTDMIYTIVHLCFSVAIPIVGSILMYIVILDWWIRYKRHGAKYHEIDNLKLVKHTRDSFFSFIILILWLFVSGPHFVSLYLTSYFQRTMTIAFFYLRYYFSIIPFLIALMYYQKFRKNFKRLWKKENKDKDDNQHNQNPIANSSDEFNQNTHSTRLGFGEDIHSVSRFSEDVYYSPSLSHTSSAVSQLENRRPSDCFMKFPVLFATETGVRVKYNTEEKSETKVPKMNKEEPDKASSLCDVNELYYTDISESTFATPMSSFKDNVSINKPNRTIGSPFELPINIDAFYNPDDMQARCGRSKSQYSKRLSETPAKNILESAFEEPKNEEEKPPAKPKRRRPLQPPPNPDNLPRLQPLTGLTTNHNIINLGSEIIESNDV